MARVTYVHDRNGLLAGVAEILNHVLDEHRTLGDGALCIMLARCHLCAYQGLVRTSGDGYSIGGDQVDLLLVGGHGDCVFGCR